MVWRKNRPLSPGELEFHLTGLRMIQGEPLPADPRREERVRRRLAQRVR